MYNLIYACYNREPFREITKCLGWKCYIYIYYYYSDVEKGGGWESETCKVTDKNHFNLPLTIYMPLFYYINHQHTGKLERLAQPPPASRLGHGRQRSTFNTLTLTIAKPKLLPTSRRWSKLSVSPEDVQKGIAGQSQWKEQFQEVVISCHKLCQVDWLGPMIPNRVGLPRCLSSLSASHGVSLFPDSKRSMVHSRINHSRQSQLASLFQVLILDLVTNKWRSLFTSSA